MGWCWHLVVRFIEFGAGLKAGGAGYRSAGLVAQYLTYILAHSSLLGQRCNYTKSETPLPPRLPSSGWKSSPAAAYTSIPCHRVGENTSPKMLMHRTSVSCI